MLLTIVKNIKIKKRKRFCLTQGFQHRIECRARSHRLRRHLIVWLVVPAQLDSASLCRHKLLVYLCLVFRDSTDDSSEGNGFQSDREGGACFNPHCRSRWYCYGISGIRCLEPGGAVSYLAVKQEHNLMGPFFLATAIEVFKEIRQRFYPIQRAYDRIQYH